MMSVQKPLKIDHFQADSMMKLGLRMPLLSSHKAGWNGICVEYHHQPPSEPPELQSTQHILAIATGASYIHECKENGRFKSKPITSGEFILHPSNRAIHNRWHSEVEFIHLYLEPTVLSQSTADIGNPDTIELIPQNGTCDPLILGIGLTLKQKLELGELSDHLYAESAANFLFIHLLQHYSSRKYTVPEYKGGLPKYKLKEAIAYINEHLGENVSLEDLANQLDMSQYHFCRLFKQSMGIAPHKYLIQQRIEQAKVLLKQKGVTISDIAAQVGFVDQSHFTKYFRQLTGITPKVYRQERLDC